MSNKTNQMQDIYKDSYPEPDNIINLLKCPNKWFKLSKAKTRFIILVIAFILIGITSQKLYHFPHFFEFTFCFEIISCITLWAMQHFSNRMNYITLKSQQSMANDFYFKHCHSSFIYILVPALVTLIFVIGGCSIFESIQFTPTFVWILALFSFTVYISIIGYIQYIALAVYIKNITSNFNNSLSAKTSWLQELKKLSNIYRTAFFTIDTLYIIAFGYFCLSSEMQVNISSYTFYFLSIIIFIAILLVFPIVSFLENKWFKKFV